MDITLIDAGEGRVLGRHVHVETREPEPRTLAVLDIADEMPTRDALRVIARYLDGMLNSGEFRRAPRITQARLRAIQMEAERLCSRDDWRVRRDLWWHLRRAWRWRTGR